MGGYYFDRWVGITDYQLLTLYHCLVYDYQYIYFNLTNIIISKKILYTNGYIPIYTCTLRISLQVYESIIREKS